MRGVFGDNIRDAVKILKGGREGIKKKMEFPMCYHSELIPTQWEQPKPEPVRTIGSCPLHDYICPLCGFGISGSPACDCLEMRS